MINIEDLTPLLKKGWVAMDEDKEWHWYRKKPVKNDFWAYWESDFGSELDMFAIAPVEDWKKSLRKVG